MYCICDFIKTQDHLSISDMSQDCEYTWSKDMPGPTGKPGGWSGGWAFYSTVENCAEIEIVFQNFNQKKCYMQKKTKEML